MNHCQFWSTKLNREEWLGEPCSRLFNLTKNHLSVKPKSTDRKNFKGFLPAPKSFYYEISPFRKRRKSAKSFFKSFYSINFDFYFIYSKNTVLNDFSYNKGNQLHQKPILRGTKLRNCSFNFRKNLRLNILFLFPINSRKQGMALIITSSDQFSYSKARLQLVSEGFSFLLIS